MKRILLISFITVLLGVGGTSVFAEDVDGAKTYYQVSNTDHGEYR